VRLSALTGTTVRTPVTVLVVDPCISVPVSVTGMGVVPTVPPTRLIGWRDDPAGMMMLAGTANAVVFELVSITVVPPAGAGMLRPTSHVIAFPVVTAMLGHVIPAKASVGTISTTKVDPEELSVAVRFTSVVVLTAVEVMVN